MDHVSIIIVNHNGEKDTQECLLSLRNIAKGMFTVSVIVVDNGSKDPFAIIESKSPTHTTVVRSDANLGFTGGNNLGISYALKHDNPDHILLLNNDTTVDRFFLQKLVQCAESHDRVGVVAPLIYFSPHREYQKKSYTEAERGQIIWYAGGSIDWRQLDAFHRGVDEFDRHHFDQQVESDFASGCCVLIPRTVLTQVGLLKKQYFLYMEDVDLSVRIAKAGYRLLFCAESHVWHKNAGSSGGAGSVLHQYYQTRNRLFFFFLYGSWRTRLTVARFALRLLVGGSAIERKAVFDWCTNQLGKQAIL